MAQPAQGDVILQNGVMWVVWVVTASKLRVMRVAQDRGPRHRADVPIGPFAVATLAGPLLVQTNEQAAIARWADFLKIGALSPAQIDGVKLALGREKIALATEGLDKYRPDPFRHPRSGPA